jgi:hypothetical protein
MLPLGRCYTRKQNFEVLKWSNPENTNTHFATDGAPRIGAQRT